MMTYESAKTYNGKIIGESNNRYRDVGFIIDEYGNYHQFYKSEVSYYLCPGTPVKFKYRQVNETNGFSAYDVKERCKGKGNKAILWDGKDKHPLVSLYNEFGKVLLRAVYKRKTGKDMESKDQDHMISCDPQNKANGGGQMDRLIDPETHHEILEKILIEVKKSDLDDLVLDKLYNDIKSLK